MAFGRSNGRLATSRGLTVTDATSLVPPRRLLFFADRLPPLVGGVEIHARFFIEHFSSHPSFSLEIITCDSSGHDARMMSGRLFPIRLDELAGLSPAIVFFNSGHWIERLRALRQSFPHSLFVYRTGGNEILKAPLESEQPSTHSSRQAFWATALNDTIDLIITNSAFTEGRLRTIGITRSFLRCVGGAQMSPHASRRTDSDLPTLFCAARFVPYKNHKLLLEVIAELKRRGVSLILRLAGGGPLREDAEAYTKAQGLSDQVIFLGELDNDEVCRETALADAYIQLSGNEMTHVKGGSYVHAEGMGRSILEAISAGTFVIAGHSGALAEVVSAERGLLVELNGVGRIADVLERLFRRPIPRSPGTNMYCWAAVFEAYERTWEELLANPHRH